MQSVINASNAKFEFNQIKEKMDSLKALKLLF